jgi:hypothetical protein
MVFKKEMVQVIEVSAVPLGFEAPPKKNRSRVLSARGSRSSVCHLPFVTPAYYAVIDYRQSIDLSRVNTSGIGEVGYRVVWVGDGRRESLVQDRFKGQVRNVCWPVR